jgi:hypothetical protein
MTSRVRSIADAYHTLGLRPGVGLIAAKKAFREHVKILHPDVTTPSPETLSRLADIVAAIRFLEQTLPACMELEISTDDAIEGISRTVRVGGRPVIVRIPPDTTDESLVSAVGEPDIAFLVRIRPEVSSTAHLVNPDDAVDLDDFIDQFSRPSANARFARWIRKAQSAA